jgi:nucleotide-binding universal stress UspA family protein
MTTATHRTVVVGYDGSPASEAAVTWAAQEAARRHAPLPVSESDRPTPN